MLFESQHTGGVREGLYIIAVTIVFLYIFFVQESFFYFIWENSIIKMSYWVGFGESVNLNFINVL